MLIRSGPHDPYAEDDEYDAAAAPLEAEKKRGGGKEEAAANDDEFPEQVKADLIRQWGLYTGEWIRQPHAMRHTRLPRTATHLLPWGSMPATPTGPRRGRSYILGPALCPGCACCDGVRAGQLGRWPHLLLPPVLYETCYPGDLKV